MSDWNQFTVNGVDPMQSMAKAFGIAGAAQNLKNSQVQGQILSQNAQQGDIDLIETQKYRGIVQNIKNYQNENGDLDFSKLIPDVMRAAPKNGPAFLQRLAQAQTTATTSKREINSLTDEARSRVGSVLATIPKGASPEDVAKTLDALNSQYADGKLPTASKHVVDAYTSTFKQGGPDAAYNTLQTMARGVLPQPTQQQMNTPEGVAFNTGRKSGVISTKPGTVVPQGQAFATTENQTPVGAQDTLQTDSQGNTYRVVRDARGNIVNTAAVPGATNSGAPNGVGPFNLPQGETQESLKYVQGIRAVANQTARSAPDQTFNANQIIKLADETNTGKGSQIIAGLRGQFSAIPWTQDSASNYNRLGHFMALQTAQLAQASGIGGTDAGRAIANEQAGNRDWTSDAIKSTARVNRALTTGSVLFNYGVENAIKNSNGNPFAAREFQNQWASVANVDAMRLYDAIKNKNDDPQGLKEVIKDLGGVSKDKNSRYQQALKHVDQMRTLIRGGQ